MVDCHIHMVLDGVNWKDAIARHSAAPQEGLIRKTLAHYQALGYSYLRDGGDRWGVCELSAQLAPEYGIRYRSPGSRSTKPGITAASSAAALRNSPNTARLSARPGRTARTLLKS